MSSSLYCPRFWSKSPRNFWVTRSVSSGEVRPLNASGWISVGCLWWTCSCLGGLGGGVFLGGGGKFISSSFFIIKGRCWGRGLGGLGNGDGLVEGGAGWATPPLPLPPASRALMDNIRRTNKSLSLSSSSIFSILMDLPVFRVQGCWGILMVCGNVALVYLNFVSTIFLFIWKLYWARLYDCAQV